MAIQLVPFALVFFLPVPPVFSQNCSLITHDIVTELLPQLHPSSDGNEGLYLLSFNITCLSASHVQDYYRFTTIFTTYIVSSSKSNETITALIDLGCSIENKWDPSVLGAEISYTSNPINLTENLRFDCALCASSTYAISNGLISDPISHCIACHSNCSVPGTLGRCTGSNSSQCCLVYTDGVCNTTCGENKHLKDNFTCTGIQSIANTSINTENSLPSSSNGLMEKITLTISSSPVVIMSLISTTPSQIIQQTNTLVSLFSPSLTPSPILTPTIIINDNDNSVDSDIYTKMIELSVLSSVITSLITTMLLISITLLVICCTHSRWKCLRANGRDPIDTLSSFDRMEYIEPLTSPSTNTERSLITTTTTDSISMQLNPAYYRTKYFGRLPHSPAVYENPNEVLAETPPERNRYIGLEETNQTYITILP